MGELPQSREQILSGGLESPALIQAALRLGQPGWSRAAGIHPEPRLLVQTRLLQRRPVKRLVSSKGIQLKCNVAVLSYFKNHNFY